MGNLVRKLVCLVIVLIAVPSLFVDLNHPFRAHLRKGQPIYGYQEAAIDAVFLAMAFFAWPRSKKK
jgi:hypothetical protein